MFFILLVLSVSYGLKIEKLSSAEIYLEYSGKITLPLSNCSFINPYEKILKCNIEIDGDILLLEDNNPMLKNNNC